jgi:hypothetical protein
VVTNFLSLCRVISLCYFSEHADHFRVVLISEYGLTNHVMIILVIGPMAN